MKGMDESETIRTTVASIKNVHEENVLKGCRQRSGYSLAGIMRIHEDLHYTEMNVATVNLTTCNADSSLVQGRKSTNCPIVQ